MGKQLLQTNIFKISIVEGKNKNTVVLKNKNNNKKKKGKQLC